MRHGYKTIQTDNKTEEKQEKNREKEEKQKKQEKTGKQKKTGKKQGKTGKKQEKKKTGDIVDMLGHGMDLELLYCKIYAVVHVRTPLLVL